MLSSRPGKIKRNAAAIAAAKMSVKNAKRARVSKNNGTDESENLVTNDICTSQHQSASNMTPSIQNLGQTTEEPCPVLTTEEIITCPTTEEASCSTTEEAVTMTENESERLLTEEAEEAGPSSFNPSPVSDSEDSSLHEESNDNQNSGNQYV